MKISLLLTAIILGLAAIIGSKQKNQIKTLTTEWEELKITAGEKNVPTDLKTAFNSQRVRSDSARAAREEAVADFARELAAFAQKVEQARNDGMSEDEEMQKEIVGFMEKLGSLTPSDLKALVKVLEGDNSIGEEIKQELMMMSVMMLSSENPEAALTICSEAGDRLGKDGQIDHMLPMILSQFASKEPVRAAEWVVENEELLGGKEERIKSGMISMAAQNDIPGALAMIETLQIEDTAKAFGGVARGVSSGSQDEFVDALRSEDLSEKEKTGIFASLAASPFIKDFEAASTWLTGSKLTDKEKESVVGGLNYHGTRNAPDKWLSWVAENHATDGAGKSATQNILSNWTQENFIEAGRWVQNQESGPAKNVAIKTYAETLAPHEPAAAAEWAETLPEGQERDLLFEKVHLNLKGKDPDSASAFAEKHGLED